MAVLLQIKQTYLQIDYKHILMIIVEQLFTRPLTQVHTEQQHIQKEILAKNKQLKNLFGIKYQELLGCTELLAGISEYTKKIIDVSNITQNAIQQLNINEAQGQIIATEQQPRKQNKSKDLQYFIKLITKQQREGNLLIAYIGAQYFIKQVNGDHHAKLCLEILLEQIQSTFKLDNILDTYFIHMNQLNSFYKQIIEYGSQGCDQYKQVVNSQIKLMQSDELQNYYQISTSFESLTIIDIYTALKYSQWPKLPINSEQQKQICILKDQIEIEFQQALTNIVNNLMKSLVVNNQFDFHLFDQLYNQKGAMTNELKAIWSEWSNSAIKSHFLSVCKLFQQFQTEQLLISHYLPLQEEFENTITLLSQLFKLLETHKEEYYTQEQCQLICQQEHKEMNDYVNTVFVSLQSSFILTLLFSLLIQRWNHIIHQYPLELTQLKHTWNLKDVDWDLNNIYTLQSQSVTLEQIKSTIRVLLHDISIPFTLELRNLVTVLHPEKSKDFYENILKEGKFNNKAIKRVALGIPAFEQQSDSALSNYLIVAPIKSQQSQGQFGTWGNVQKPKIEPVVQKAPVEGKGRFGIGFKWGK